MADVDNPSNRHSSESFDRRLVRINEINQAFKKINHNPQRILDVGFGNGAIINYFYERGIFSVGIEVVKGFVDDAQSRFPNLELIHYDGINFPLEENMFDTVLLNDVLEHISYEDIESVFSEIRRVLNPGGIVYISVMNRWQLIEPHTLIPLLTWLPRFAWNPVCKRISGRDYIKYWPYTRNRLHSLLKRHNLPYKDLTGIYVENKFKGLNPIGDRTTSKIVRLLRKLRLIKIVYYIALKLSVLIYVAKVE